MKCVQQLPTLVEQPLQKAAIQATQTWLDDPSDGNRRKAHNAAEAVGLDQPAGCVAMAAFFSEGSLVPAELQPVAAPPQAAPISAACAIILAAVIQNPENAADRYKSFLQLGHETIEDRGEPAPLSDGFATCSDISPRESACLNLRRCPRLRQSHNLKHPHRPSRNVAGINRTIDAVRRNHDTLPSDVKKSTANNGFVVACWKIDR